MVAIKFVTDAAFNQLEKHLLNKSSISQLQQPLTDFLHRLETQLARVDLWFGAAFLVLAAMVLGRLWFTRQKSPGKRAGPSDKDESPEGQGTDDRPPLPVFKQPSPPKRPRLIQ